MKITSECNRIFRPSQQVPFLLIPMYLSFWPGKPPSSCLKTAVVTPQHLLWTYVRPPLGVTDPPFSQQPSPSSVGTCFPLVHDGLNGLASDLPGVPLKASPSSSNFFLQYGHSFFPQDFFSPMSPNVRRGTSADVFIGRFIGQVPRQRWTLRPYPALSPPGPLLR